MLATVYMYIKYILCYLPIQFLNAATLTVSLGLGIHYQSKIIEPPKQNSGFYARNLAITIELL